MKILFISRDYSNMSDGGSIVAHRNLTFLKNITANIDELVVPKATLPTLFWNYLFNQSYGSTPKLNKAFKKLLKNNYDFIWFDGSHYGGYLEQARAAGLKTICFFHNVEYDFYQAKANVTKRLLDKLFVSFIKRNETKSVRNATLKIMLNERDNKRLEEIYEQRADYMLPTSFNAIPKESLTNRIGTNDSKYLLFVGSNFYANQEAVEYLFTALAPRIAYKIKIVGSICDNYHSTEVPPNVELEGRVDDLRPYYVNATAVISPILSGAGTKTKTIEALGYGKTILGSPEALKGIPAEFYPKIGKLCQTDEDYLNGIKELSDSVFNEEAYEIFMKYYSSEAIFDNFLAFLKKTIL